MNTYGPWGAVIIAVVTVLFQYLRDRDKMKNLEAQIKQTTQEVTKAKHDAEEFRKQNAEWERRETACQQLLLATDRRLIEKERETLKVYIELRDMQAKVIELQEELERRPKPRRVG